MEFEEIYGNIGRKIRSFILDYFLPMPKPISLLISLPVENARAIHYVENLNRKERLHKLLDLDSDISDEERTEALKEIIQNKLFSKVQDINTEEGLSNELKKNPQRQLALTLAVKRHLNLPE